jgi:WD40 repeat protein
MSKDDDSSPPQELFLYEAGGGRAKELVWSKKDDAMIRCISQGDNGGLWNCDANTGVCAQTYSLGISRWFSELLALDQYNEQWVATSIYPAGVVKLLNLQCLGDDRLIRHNADCISVVAFCPSGSYVATGGDHRILQVWDIIGRQVKNDQEEAAAIPCTLRLYGLESKVTSVAFSLGSDASRWIAASNVDGRVGAWDVTSGKCMASLNSDDKKAVATVIFTPDGTMLATAGNDGMVRFWSRAHWVMTTNNTAC